MAYIENNGGILFETLNIKLLDEDALERGAIRDGRGNCFAGGDFESALLQALNAESTHIEI